MLRAVLESAAQAILTVNEQGRILTANARTTEMFGYPSEELLGQTVELLLPESARQSHIQSRKDYTAAPRVRLMGLGMELSGRKKDGSQFPVEISLSYTRTDGGVVAIAFISDISVRKTLEEQLLQSQKMEAIGRLAGGIAHDFNNLLTIISGYNRMMLDTLSPLDPMRGYAAEILKASDRASALTKQLLAFSRRQIAQPAVMNVNDLIQHSEKMLRRLITESIELVVHTQPDLDTVKVDATQFEQVLLNLVVNARDALPLGGTITIETGNVELDEEYTRTHLGVRPGPYVMMAVSDNGTGMDAETKRHMFEPFFTTKAAERGTGLGLSTVYGIVKQNFGDIWVYSELGVGTTLKIYLPRVQAAESSSSEPVAVPPAPRGTETVLVVEDELGVRQLIANILRNQGYTVLEAGNTLEAVPVFEEHKGRIGLLVTDVIMPHGSGRELAAQFKSRQPDLKVLYISGYTENTIVHHGILEDDVEFLAKPFTFEGLLSKVRAVLNKK
jgi:PAS domain S-box-containing protein